MSWKELVTNKILRPKNFRCEGFLNHLAPDFPSVWTHLRPRDEVQRKNQQCPCNLLDRRVATVLTFFWSDPVFFFSWKTGAILSVLRSWKINPSLEMYSVPKLTTIIKLQTSPRVAFYLEGASAIAVVASLFPNWLRFVADEFESEKCQTETCGLVHEKERIGRRGWWRRCMQYACVCTAGNKTC